MFDLSQEKKHLHKIHIQRYFYLTIGSQRPIEVCVTFYSYSIFNLKYLIYNILLSKYMHYLLLGINYNVIYQLHICFCIIPNRLNLIKLIFYYQT